MKIRWPKSKVGLGFAIIASVAVIVGAFGGFFIPESAQPILVLLRITAIPGLLVGGIVAALLVPIIGSFNFYLYFFISFFLNVIFYYFLGKGAEILFQNFRGSNPKPTQKG